MKRIVLTLICGLFVISAIGQEPLKAFAVKYVNENGTTYIYSTDGKQKRLDTFWEKTGYDDDYNEFTYTEHEVHLFFSGKEDPVSYVDKAWKVSFVASQHIGNFRSMIGDKSELYMNLGGFSPAGETTILGKPCKVYAGTTQKMVNARGIQIAGYDPINDESIQGEFAVWNGIVLDIKKNNTSTFKAEAFTTDVPAEAFTKTIEVTWIK